MQKKQIREINAESMLPSSTEDYKSTTRVETKTFFNFREKRKWACFREILFRENFYFAKVFAKKFVFAKVLFWENQNFPKSFRLRVSFLRQVTTKILQFNVNFSSCLWLLSHLFWNTIRIWPSSWVPLQ
jgi:hypothetical protein